MRYLDQLLQGRFDVTTEVRDQEKLVSFRPVGYERETIVQKTTIQKFSVLRLINCETTNKIELPIIVTQKG